jgi:MbtH protein
VLLVNFKSNSGDTDERRPEMAEEPYCVVVNDELQYSVWPLGLDVPAGWRLTDRSGSHDECITHIEEIWVDMRPLGLQKAGVERIG